MSAMFGSLDSRPRIQVPYTSARIALEAVAIAGLAFIALQLYLSWSALPDRVPTHFGFSGQPDRWSSRGGVLIGPLIAFSCWLLMTVLERFPHIHNFPMEVTQENAPRLYAMSIGLLSVIKTEIVCLSAYTLWATIEVTTGRAAPSRHWARWLPRSSSVRLPMPLPGEYQIEISKDGFAPHQRSALAAVSAKRRACDPATQSEAPLPDRSS